MKTLYIDGRGDGVYYLCDTSSGEVLASHLCSNKHYAKSDLLDGRTERQNQLKEKYNDDVQTKFFDEQSDITIDEFVKLNKEWYQKELEKESKEKTIVTFGSGQLKELSGKIRPNDVALIIDKPEPEARTIVMDSFIGKSFCTTYPYSKMDEFKEKYNMKEYTLEELESLQEKR